MPVEGCLEIIMHKLDRQEEYLEIIINSHKQMQQVDKLLHCLGKINQLQLELLLGDSFLIHKINNHNSNNHNNNNKHQQPQLLLYLEIINNSSSNNNNNHNNNNNSQLKEEHRLVDYLQIRDSNSSQQIPHKKMINNLLLELLQHKIQSREDNNKLNLTFLLLISANSKKEALYKIYLIVGKRTC